MPWSIDGPSSDQLGYLNRRKERIGEDAPRTDRRPRRHWPWFALFAGAALVLTVSLVLAPAWFQQPPIATKAVGVWRELDTPEHLALVVESDGSGTYQVDYPRAASQRAVLSDDKIELLRWSNSGHVTCTLTYDAESDHLIATTSDGTFVLERRK